MTIRPIACLGLSLLASCGGGMKRIVTTAPLPVVESCSVRVAQSTGWRLSVTLRSVGVVRLVAFVPGRVYEPASSPSATTGYVTPLRDGTKVIGTTTVMVDHESSPTRTRGRGLFPLVLKATGPGETTLETRSYGVTPYREIAERCAAPPDSASD